MRYYIYNNEWYSVGFNDRIERWDNFHQRWKPSLRFNDELAITEAGAIQKLMVNSLAKMMK